MLRRIVRKLKRFWQKLERKRTRYGSIDFKEIRRRNGSRLENRIRGYNIERFLHKYGKMQKIHAATAAKQLKAIKINGLLDLFRYEKSLPEKLSQVDLQIQQIVELAFKEFRREYGI